MSGRIAYAHSAPQPTKPIIILMTDALSAKATRNVILLVIVAAPGYFVDI
jgi:hypothetical protein